MSSNNNGEKQTIPGGGSEVEQGNDDAGGAGEGEGEGEGPGLASMVGGLAYGALAWGVGSLVGRSGEEGEGGAKQQDDDTAGEQHHDTATRGGRG